MSRKNGWNSDLVSVSVDGSHEEQVNQKVVIYLLPQKKLTVGLTVTSNSDNNSVHTDDYKEDYLPAWNLITINDE